MHLLRHRPRSETRWLELPSGERRRVKVSVNDEATIQQVEDGDVLHGTARPKPIRINLREMDGRGAPLRERVRSVFRPAIRQGFVPREDGLWAPLPEGELV